MKLTRTILVLALALISLAACGGETPKARSSPTASTSPSPVGPAIGSVVDTTSYLDSAHPSDQWDLWLYDPSTDRTTRLTTDGKKVIENQARFSGTKVTYATDADKVIELDTTTGKRRTLLTADGRLLAYAVSPDGNRVAYIDVNYERDSVHHLRIRNLTTNRTTELKRLGVPPGRGAGDDDVVSIVWSSTGEQLLINDTHLDVSATARVIASATGADVITPIKASTGAFWSGDERSIFIIITPAAGGVRAWYRIDLSDGSRHKFNADPEVVHARLSPDGRKIAATTFLNKNDTYAVYVYEIATGKELLRKDRFRDPLWLDDGTLAVTRVEKCSNPDSDCGAEGFQGTGTSKMSLDGAQQKIALGSTLWTVANPNGDILLS